VVSTVRSTRALPKSKPNFTLTLNPLVNQPSRLDRWSVLPLGRCRSNTSFTPLRSIRSTILRTRLSPTRLGLRSSLQFLSTPSRPRYRHWPPDMIQFQSRRSLTPSLTLILADTTLKQLRSWCPRTKVLRLIINSVLAAAR